MPADLRDSIQSALAAFADKSLRFASTDLLRTLGYQSDRTLDLAGSKPQSFLDLIVSQSAQSRFDEAKALFPEWKSADILFQLTDDELSRHTSLFKETTVKTSLLQSYLFFAIELKGRDYARGKLTGIARQINRVFPMPVMVMLKHGDLLSIAVINRRQNKVHADKDVLEKVTLIRDISLASPHRGHLDILASFAVQNLVHPQKKPIQDFDTLHAAWEQIFNIELLNERFYKELSNWYFWALPQVDFPADLEPDDEKRRATGLIRLLTRLIFCWFLKEKDGLIPEKLFHPADLAKLLKGFDPESETSSTYYQAILQNLFFATLNQRMGKDGKGNPYRVFATDEGFQKNRATYDVNNLYRYEKLFAVPQEEALALFADIPFLNGGLFECLDRTEDGTDKKRYLDGFSRNAKKRPHVPDRLFFDSGETADLSEVYGDKKRKSERVTGLISILNRYKFTIVENTPIDQEIALDPELLGKVFENLLASYNEETKTTARKQTGSFYTPRPIVDYMVDESLKAHLERKLTTDDTENTDSRRAGSPSVNSVKSVVKEKLDHLFTYTEEPHPFTDSEVAALITAIDEVKILDPACGSGAFPMGVLHKLVYILGKLDPDNARWKQTQLAKLDSAPMREALEAAFEDNNDDYGRKLYLIENCLYGVDIQPIAIQITKLRFFISLVCDQKTNRSKKDNHGIRPLPNLETKFVAADTLIGLPISDKDLFIESLIAPIEKEIEAAYHSHFTIQRRDQKLALQKKIKVLRLKLAETLAGSLGAVNSKKAKHLADWDPFDPQSRADFFDPHWMFGRSLKDGFDVVIGNPPYVRIQMLAQADPKQPARIKQQYVSASKGNYDLYVVFVERGLQLLQPHGQLSYILPHKFFNAQYGEPLRKLLADGKNLRQVVHFGDEQIFPGATNYVCLLFLDKGGAEDCRWYRADNLPAWLADGAATGTSIDSGRFTSSEWNFVVGKGEDLFEKLQRMPMKLGDVASLFVGLQTDADDVFIVEVVSEKNGTLIARSKFTKQEHEFEAGHLKPFLKGSLNVRRYALTDLTKRLIFPYETRDGSSRLITESEYERQFPKTWKYLQTCRKRLIARSGGEFADYWHGYVYKKNHTRFDQSKLVVPAIGTGACFAADFEGKYYFVGSGGGGGGGYGVVLKPEMHFELRYLLGVLNAQVSTYSLKQVSTPFRGGYLALTRQFIEQLPIRPIDFAVAAERAQHDAIVSLVERILAAKQPNPAADTSALEREIDQQVYALYGLTPEEIAIVEGTGQ